MHNFVVVVVVIVATFTAGTDHWMKIHAFLYSIEALDTENINLFCTNVYTAETRNLAGCLRIKLQRSQQIKTLESWLESSTRTDLLNLLLLIVVRNAEIHTTFERFN